MSEPKYTKLVQSLPATVPFVGPEAQERSRGKPFAARLGANENVFGPSPKAIKAMQDAAGETWKYGDSESHDLRHALACHHNVPAGNILVGEGIDGLLGYLVRLLIEPGDAVVTSAGAYPTFNYHVAGFGGVVHTVPYRNDNEDPDALLAKAAETGAKLIYLANPDNPMGGMHGPDIIARMIDNVPDGATLILDEAYVEFARQTMALPLEPDRENLIRLRTFSKAYGMAGARVGYAIAAEPLITAFHKIRNHFGMARVSQAGALAALADSDYLIETQTNVENGRSRIHEIAANNGLKTLPSATNFVAIDCGRDDNFARAVLVALEKRDIFVRKPFVAPQNRCIRVSVGKPKDLDAFEAALPGALEDAKNPAHSRK